MISRHQDCVDVVWSYLIDRDQTAQHLSSESDLNAAELWLVHRRMWHHLILSEHLPL